MRRFQDILVGVDLAAGDRLVGDRIGEPSQCAIDRAIWLAKQSGARLCFAYALDVAAATERLIEEHETGEPNVFDAAIAVMDQILQRAAGQGIAASSRVLFGRSWHRLICEVLRHSHDLVVVGTRDAGPLQRVLIGSTAMKLLRKCPCPVWVTKPGSDSIDSVLVAHDLTAVGELALQLGSSMADLNHAELRVLHSVEHPEYDDVLPARVTHEESTMRRQAARDQIEAEMKHIAAAQRYDMVITDVRPEYAILEAIEAHDVDLIVMGTIARTGIRGFITGNTAERVLPLLPCSVLAVKPNEFECPIELDD